jgi:hypothetical protein
MTIQTTADPNAAGHGRRSSRWMTGGTTGKICRVPITSRTDQVAAVWMQHSGVPAGEAPATTSVTIYRCTVANDAISGL